ncbi:MAG TPA: hypothetical protein VKD90_22980 [Gemmataceae bacterium]|nr:hypothetical protein [Gemmataceae bacterium]
MRQWLAGIGRAARRSWGGAAAVLALVLVAGPVLAVGPGTGPTGGGRGGGGDTGGGGGGGPGGTQVPEINPGSAAAALTLLTGATLIVLDRRRRTQAAPEAS